MLYVYLGISYNYMNEIYTLKGKGADHWLKPIQYGGHHE